MPSTTPAQLNFISPAIAANENGLFLGINEHAGEEKPVSLTREQRLRHMHIIGTSGTGKTTLLQNLIKQDIEAGEGFAVLDPHGDLIDTILGMIPPSRVDDVVYFCADGGVLTAHDAKTGKQLYRTELTKFVHRSHLVASEGKIYVTAANGTTDIVQAGKEFKKVATNALPDTVFAGPAVADGRIYFRGYGYLWAIGSK